MGVQAINLSHAKAYNVRAVIEADGFSPMGTIFIGNVDGGMSAEGTGSVAVTGLTRSSFSYGQTKGTGTFFYEDAEEDATGQWWIIMTAVAAVIVTGGAVAAVRRRKGCGV